MDETIVPLEEQYPGETGHFDLPDEEIDLEKVLAEEAVEPELLVSDEDIEGDADIPDLDDDFQLEDDEGDVFEDAEYNYDDL